MAQDNAALQSDQALEGARNRSHQAILAGGQAMGNALAAAPQQFIQARAQAQAMQQRADMFQYETGMAQLRMEREELTKQAAYEQLQWAQQLHQEDMLNAQRRIQLAQATEAEKRAELLDLELKVQAQKLEAAGAGGYSPADEARILIAGMKDREGALAMGLMPSIDSSGRPRMAFIGPDDPRSVEARKSIEGRRESARSEEAMKTYFAMYEENPDKAIARFGSEFDPETGGLIPVSPQKRLEAKQRVTVGEAASAAVQSARSLVDDPSMIDQLIGSRMIERNAEQAGEVLNQMNVSGSRLDLAKKIYLSRVRADSEVWDSFNGDEATALAAAGFGPIVEKDDVGNPVVETPKPGDPAGVSNAVQHSENVAKESESKSFPEGPRALEQAQKARYLNRRRAAQVANEAILREIELTQKSGDIPAFYTMLKNDKTFKRLATPSELFRQLSTDQQNAVYALVDMKFNNEHMKESFDRESFLREEFSPEETNPFEFADGDTVSRPELQRAALAQAYASYFNYFVNIELPKMPALYEDK